MAEKQTVLIADDDVTFRTLIADAFMDRGFTVIQAADGEECFTLIKESAPDAILLDIKMPTYSGVDVLHQLREQGIAEETPIFMLTQVDDIETVTETVQKEIRGYFIKNEQSVEMLVAEVEKQLDEAS